jgi:hypothetical protein
MNKPVFTDQFYIDKFMEIQQQNIVMYKMLLAIQEDAILKEQIESKFGSEFFSKMKDYPA